MLFLRIHLMVFRSRYMFVSIFVLVMAVSAHAQTVDELTRRYGLPDDNGHYTVRPGVSMTVSMKEGMRVREMVIESSVALEIPAKALDDVLDEVIEELAPKVLRGRRISDMTFWSSCNSMGHADYEDVEIGQSTGCEVVSGKSVVRHKAVIRWKQ